MLTKYLKIQNPFLNQKKNYQRHKRENYDTHKVPRDIRTLYKSNAGDYYKPISTGNTFSTNYIEYESNGDKDKMISIEDYLDKI